MSKGKNESPPIKANPKLGKETATDAAVVWGGARLSEESKQPGVAATSKQPGVAATSKPSKGKKRPTPQIKLTLKGKALEALRELMEIYGQSASTVAGTTFVERLAEVKKRLQ